MKFNDVTLVAGEIYSRRSYESKKGKFLAGGVKILKQLSETGTAMDAMTGLKISREIPAWWPAGKISQEFLSVMPAWTVSFQGEDLHFALAIPNFNLPANWEEDPNGHPGIFLATMSTVFASDPFRTQQNVSELAKEILEMRPVCASVLAPSSNLRYVRDQKKIQQAYQNASRISLSMAGAFFENRYRFS